MWPEIGKVHPAKNNAKDNAVVEVEVAESIGRLVACAAWFWSSVPVPHCLHEQIFISQCPVTDLILMASGRTRFLGAFPARPIVISTPQIDVR